MDVALLRIGIDLQLGERFAEIHRHRQRADLDANQQPIAVQHDVLDVTDARRRREEPFVDARRLAEPGEVAPRLALVLADVDMRRQRADQHHVAALQLAAARRPQIEMREAVVAPRPGHAAVFASRDTDAVGRGEQRAVVERGDRADEAAGQRPVLDRPAVGAARQHGDAVDGADHDGVRALLRAVNVAAAVGDQDHRAALILHRETRFRCRIIPENSQGRLCAARCRAGACFPLPAYLLYVAGKADAGANAFIN